MERLRSLPLPRLIGFGLASGAGALMVLGTFRTLWGLLVSGYLPVDFAAYYAASKLLLGGNADLLYDLKAQNRIVAQILPSPVGSSAGDYPPYIYLPALAALIAPLASLPFQLAAYLWAVVNLLLTAGYARVLVRLAGIGGSRAAWMLVMAALLLFNPTQEALILGQVTPLLVLLTAVAVLWAVDRPSRAIPSGLMLGLAAGVKLFPIAMVIPAAMRRQWSVVVAATAGLLGVVIAGMALPYGLQLTAQYSTHVVARLPHPWMPLNLGLSSTLGMALAGVSFEVAVFSAGNPMHFEFPPLIPLPAAAAVLGWAVSLAVAGLGLAGTYRVRHDAVAAWMLWIVSLILAMPLVWGHYFMLLPVALALLWRRAPSEAVWWALLVFSGFALNRFYRPLLYLGVHPALTNLLALGPVLVLWIEGLRRAFAASGAHSDSFRMP